MRVHIFSDKNVGVFAIFNIYFIFVIVLIFSDKNVRMLASEQTILGYYDKKQNLDFGPTHQTGGAKHKINDFCFLKFFISMKFDPSQAQKTIFSRFQLCGISLDMF